MAGLVDDIPRFFGEGGPLPGLLPGYRPRSAQIEMALSVAEALETPGARLVVEAGTGTGKSLAYLVPALLSGRQVAVATGTKALQDQLYVKDLPLVLEAVHRFAGLEKRGALMKGRQNYLCLTRFERFAAQPMFAFHEEARHLDSLKEWVTRTTTGDRAELASLPDDYRTWSDLDAGSETCVGSKCPAFQDCYVTRMRRVAEAADLIVVNHHLLCADLRVRLEGVPAQTVDEDGDDGATGTAFAQVIPDVDALVIDEAHQLPEVATSYFGVQYATARGDRLAADVARWLPSGSSEIRRGVDGALARFSAHFEALVGQLGPPPPGEERFRLDGRVEPKAAKALAEHIRSALADLCMRLETLAEAAAPRSTEQVELDGLARRAENMALELSFILEQALPDPRFVTFLEAKKRGFALGAAPIDVGAALAQTLFTHKKPMVLTSATLAVAGHTAAFEDRVGLTEARAAVLAAAGDDDGGAAGAATRPAAARADEGEVAPPRAASGTALAVVDEGKAPPPRAAPPFVWPEPVSKVLPSPFDYATRAALYAPADMPAPDDASYQERFEEEVRFLLELSGGGALLLFTSYRALTRTWERIGPDLEEAGLLVLKQGDAPKLALLEALKASDDAFAVGPEAQVPTVTATEDPTADATTTKKKARRGKAMKKGGRKARQKKTARRPPPARGTVLFATQSFWEGVDVPGAALRMVIIDRLPFRPPTDPVQKARQELVEQKGRSSFFDVSLPEAALGLKQGVGRLLRSEEDAGVVAILDGRLRKKSYGQVFLQTLPPLCRVGSQRVVRQFWERCVLPALEAGKLAALAEEEEPPQAERASTGDARGPEGEPEGEPEGGSEEGAPEGGSEGRSEAPPGSAP